MLNIKEIYEENSIKEFLVKRRLLTQYLKSTKFLLAGNFAKLDFKLREPKKDEIYSFRINKQFRAFGYFEENGIFIVFEINNHSNF
ncbi:MAG: hypothetical protein PHI37_00940 [Candidatus Gracilibacteria bacterium]|nr:hypothetical protein [Candidatus Gracilibacteria bacterium]